MIRTVIAGACLAAALAAGSPASAQPPPGLPAGNVSPQEMTREHLEHGSVTNRLMLMTASLSETMAKLSGMLNQAPPARMKSVAGVMQDVAALTLEISRLLDKGAATAPELTRVQEQLALIQQRVSTLEPAQ